MKHRILGRTGIEVAPLAFGGNVFGWTIDQAKSFELLDRFIEQGLNTIDTADVYSAWAPGLRGGESEQIMGAWLKERQCRHSVVICTKVGMWRSRPGLSAKNIEAGVEDSLQRLQTDYIDVYFAHIDDVDTPREETLRAFERLLQNGKVRSIGASNHSANSLSQALQLSQEYRLPAYQVIQPRYNLYDRAEFEQTLAPLAKSKNMGVMTYFALASGFLTGKYANINQIKNTPRERLLNKYFDARGQNILKTLLVVAQDRSATPAQVALAWLLSNSDVTAPIVSATSTEQLDELIGVFSINLDASEIERLNQASNSPCSDAPSS